jgi:Sec23-binding domain of Sec16
MVDLYLLFLLPSLFVVLTRLRMYSGDSGEKKSIERVQYLLLRGERTNAVEVAMAIGDFATALLLASMCDTVTYKRVARKYAEHAYTTASPMYTTALLFSESLEAPSSRRPMNWGVKPGELKNTWKTHLAAIISNRVNGWDKIVLSLGDRLYEIGNVNEAHFCYMVCGYPITKPTDTKARIALLGCKHSHPSNLVLFTDEALAAYERTEAYEWAKRKGNRNASLRSFQPFKLIYAMLLADIGQIDKSKSFLKSIRLSTGVMPVHTSESNSFSVYDLFDDDCAFALVCDETRKQLTTKAEPKVKYSQSFLKGQKLKIQTGSDSTIGGMSQSKTPKPKRNEGPLQLDPLSAQDVLYTPAPTTQATNEPQTVLSDPDASYRSAKSNLLDVTGYSMGPVDDAPPATVDIGKSEPSSAALPPLAAVTETEESSRPETAANREAQNPQIVPQIVATPQERRRPKSPPATAPPVMMGKKVEKPRTPAPASGGGGMGSSFKSWLIKKLNPNATQIHLPESNGEAYYDKDRKRKSKIGSAYHIVALR